MAAAPSPPPPAPSLLPCVLLACCVPPAVGEAAARVHRPVVPCAFLMWLPVQVMTAFANDRQPPQVLETLSAAQVRSARREKGCCCCREGEPHPHPVLPCAFRSFACSYLRRCCPGKHVTRSTVATVSAVSFPSLSSLLSPAPPWFPSFSGAAIGLTSTPT